MVSERVQLDIPLAPGESFSFWKTFVSTDSMSCAGDNVWYYGYVTDPESLAAISHQLLLRQPRTEQPGARFNGKLRGECLNCERFDTLLEAQVVIEGWRREYNQIRPHSSLNYRSPAGRSLRTLRPC